MTDCFLELQAVFAAENPSSYNPGMELTERQKLFLKAARDYQQERGYGSWDMHDIGASVAITNLDEVERLVNELIAMDYVRMSEVGGPSDIELTDEGRKALEKL